jgi:ATP-dependent DNA ligase
MAQQRSLRDRGGLAEKAAARAAENLGRLVEAGVLLAHTYEKEKPPPNPKNWWVSEKLDGVRAYWNGIPSVPLSLAARGVHATIL